MWMYCMDVWVWRDCTFTLLLGAIDLYKQFMSSWTSSRLSQRVTSDSDNAIREAGHDTSQFQKRCSKVKPFHYYLA